MTTPQTKTELITQIRQVQDALTQTVDGQSDEAFDSGTTELWSAASYLKHLVLSIKPFAKALTMPKEQMQTLFGAPSHPSKSYEGLVADYNQKLAEGVRAEDFNGVTPVAYRMPEGTENARAHLLDVWNDAHVRLFQALEGWADEDLDRYQLPHPALGLITLREMLFFTLHHNTLHWHDIQQTQVA